MWRVAFAVDLDDGRRVFAKTHASAPPQFFTTEATGLAWLRAADAVAIPEVLAVSDDPPNHLVLEWIDEGRPAPMTESELGVALGAPPPRGRAELRPRGPPHHREPRPAERTLRHLGRVLRREPPAAAGQVGPGLPRPSGADHRRAGDDSPVAFPSSAAPRNRRRACTATSGPATASSTPMAAAG